MQQPYKKTPLYKKVFFDIKTSQFSFNSNLNIKSVIIKFKNSTLTEVRLADVYDTYYFAYKFENNISSFLRTQFFNELRFGTVFRSEKDKKSFILKATTELNEIVRMGKFGAIIYPKSRSEMNKDIIKHLNKYFRVVPATFELIKEIPKNIRFDYDRFTEEILNDTFLVGEKLRLRYTSKQKEQIINKISEIENKIWNSNYFSIAESVNSNKLKPFFDAFLKFKSNTEERLFRAIQNKSVLIIDDVSTTGTTIFDMIKTIKSLSPYSRIIVFTVIGKETI